MKALEAQGFPHTIATQNFISHVDLFFDCLNVSTTFGGKKKLKDACQPYTNGDDWRLKVINLNKHILLDTGKYKISLSGSSQMTLDGFYKI